MDIPKALNNVIDSFKLAEVVDWVEEMFRFYLHPVTFFKILFSKEKEQQYRQITFNFFLFLIFLIITSTSFSVFNSSKSLFRISVHALFFAIIICMVFAIVNDNNLKKIIDKPYNKICTIIFLATIFLFIPSEICSKVFYSTENYLWLFLELLIDVIGFLYSMLLSWHVLILPLGKVLCGYFLTFVIINVINSFSLVFDSYYRQPELDLIGQEWNSHISDSLHDLTLIDSRLKRNFLNQPTQTYFGIYNRKTNRIDSSSMLEFGSVHFLAHANIKYIDSVMPSIHFARNKHLLHSMRVFCFEIDKHLRPSSKDSFISGRWLIIPKSGALVLSDSIFKFEDLNIDFKKEYIEMTYASKWAFYPIEIISRVFTPSEYLQKWFYMKQ